jgi:MipA family protein
MDAFMALKTSAALAASLAALLSFMASDAAAQAFDAVRLFGPAGQQRGLVGLAAVAGREYMGSDERRTRVLPLLDYQWRNGFFAGTSNGIGYNFSARPDLDFGLRVTANLGREEERSPRLRGLGDIDPAAEIGAFLNLSLLREVTLTSSVRYGAGNDNKGLVLDLGAVYSTELSASWRLAVGVAGSIVNDEYMQEFFGITPAQSVRSGYAPFTATAGVRDVRANLSLTYSVSRRWSVTGGVILNRLLDDAADSPLAVKDSTVNGVLAVSYAF